MVTTWDDISYDQYLQDRYEEDLKEEAIKKHKENLIKDNIYDYYLNHSSKKEEKISYCIEQAKSLYETEFFNSSLINSVIAIEIIIRFFLVRPIVQGSFLHWEWADILSQRIIKGKTYKDREILPGLLRLWDIDVTEEKIKNGNQFWESLKDTISARNNYVHNEKIISKKEAKIALQSLEKIVDITETICQKVEYNFTLDI